MERRHLKILENHTVKKIYLTHRETLLPQSWGGLLIMNQKFIIRLINLCYLRLSRSQTYWEFQTTITGLSEGFLGFKNDIPSDRLFDYYQIDKSLIPEVVPNFIEQARVSKKRE